MGPQISSRFQLAGTNFLSEEIKQALIAKFEDCQTELKTKTDHKLKSLLFIYFVYFI